MSTTINQFGKTIKRIVKTHKVFGINQKEKLEIRKTLKVQGNRRKVLETF